VDLVPEWSAEDIDPSIPSIARMYDYLLGGFNNFEADRALAAQLAQTSPDMVASARANRAFLRRVVNFLVREAGIAQIIDLGSGIPTAGNVHEVAQKLNSEVRVAYVDIDPIAVHISENMLSDNPYAIAVRMDLTNIDAILADPDVRGLIDLDRPVAVLALSVLHFVGDEERLRAAMAAVRESVVAGSALSLSHITIAGTALTDQLVTLSKRTPTPGTSRSHGQISALFDGFDLVDPGVVPVAGWRPDDNDTSTVAAATVQMLGGVGIKPR
jgi:hypothetical protein